MKIDNVDQSSSEKTDEFEKCDEVSGTTLNSSQSTSNSPENDDIIEEEEHVDHLTSLP